MGKKKNSTGNTSKGERRSSMKTSQRDPGTRLINQLTAHLAGKHVMVTVENPNKHETDKPFIRVNSRTVWKYSKK
jgi:hypothetical protein|tara:strand:+ start:235 stop:459 length:225 start_codon:yes stop_codon:yes gene_type:complete